MGLDVVDPSRIYRRKQVEQEASAWLERLERTLKQGESTLLREWLKSASHRRTIVERCMNFHGPEILSVLNKLIPEEVAAAKLEPPDRRRRTRIAALLGLCGGLLAMQLVGWMPWSERSATSRFEGTYRTPVGARREVNLPDGSTITLNTATLVNISFGISGRAVTIMHGEASFDVKPDATRPLRLRVGRRLLQTEAAQFVVHRISREEVEFTIAAGSVTVQHEPGGTPKTPAQLRDSFTFTFGDTTLQASQSGTIGLGWQAVRTLEPDEVRSRFAWQQGLIILTDEELASALAQIGRYTPTELVLGDQRLRELRVSGRFRTGDVDSVRSVLRKQYLIDSHLTENGRVVFGS